MMNIKLAFISMAILLSCNARESESKSKFTKPIIVQVVPMDSIKYFTLDFLNGSNPYFDGKHKFCDTLFVPYKRRRDTSYRRDYIELLTVSKMDSLRMDGFELYPDYHTIVYKNDWDFLMENVYYPVYLVNQTPLTKVVIGKDGYIFGLQEALDTNGDWRPIEFRGSDFCGHGYWGLKVHSGEFISILFPKYTGNYKTKIRVRIKNGENVYVSKAFDGMINEKQFYMQQRGYLHKQLIENKFSTIQYLFYGAQPFGMDE